MEMNFLLPGMGCVCACLKGRNMGKSSYLVEIELVHAQIGHPGAVLNGQKKHSQRRRREVRRETKDASKSRLNPKKTTSGKTKYPPTSPTLARPIVVQRRQPSHSHAHLGLGLWFHSWFIAPWPDRDIWMILIHPWLHDKHVTRTEPHPCYLWNAI
ncbi:hypothetical protein TCAL_04056 [Tigriopus californicus]|uniref:Uncharacterized protein n=1 Tax=Tigriopus californicus TaxID=6832 RepID=A0A553PFY7_TIGCA|nr:hypothetical protein TCAL_04056 [Tigriopus californicus]|eukprot:TCALIF_04056-PA protein Name:"Protein of unknown function" AED:0.55 eAED:1.00 QI:0/0/0/0.5/1/1/2/0/155